MSRRALPPYRPDPTAPPEGEWVPLPRLAFLGEQRRWRQAHDALLREALWSWKGWPTAMQLHMKDEHRGREVPGSGSGKHMREQARALLWELTHNTKPAPILYRGSHRSPEGHGAASWTELRAVARKWAKKNGGRVFTLRDARGLRVQDYVGEAGTVEREWIVVL